MKFFNKTRQKNTSSPIIEAYKSIRTNLLSVLDNSDSCKVITLSSPSSSEGKTTTAINLSIALAQLSKKVLLIDADMRRPSVHKKLKLKTTVGFADIMLSERRLEQAIVTAGATFDVITASKMPVNPDDILCLPTFDTIISQLKSAYDYIIIDTPSLDTYTDGLVLAKKTDGMILVIKNNKTMYKAYDKTVKMLEDHNIAFLGTILNGSKEKL